AEMPISAGANVGAVTRIGQYTPLHLASKSGNTAVVDALLKAGADVKARTTNTGVTPLHLAAGAGSVEAAKRLIDGGADVNAKEAEWGQTPLIFAAAQNRVDVIRILLARGADPKIATKTVDVAHELALDRAASQLQRKIPDGAVPKGQQPTGSQVQAAIRAARELIASGKIPPPDPAAAGGRGGRGGRGGAPAGGTPDPDNAANAA